MQRGGSPSLRDRLMASRMGFHAIELVNQGVANRVVVTQKGAVTDMDIDQALATTKQIDDKALEMAERLSI